jgi:hypothetical protein
MSQGSRLHSRMLQMAPTRDKHLEIGARVCMCLVVIFSKSQQLLKPSEEEAVKDWLVHQSGAAHPLHSRDLCARVTDITGKHPGQNWHRRFLARHKKSLSTRKPRNLDPKRAQKLQQDDISSFERTLISMPTSTSISSTIFYSEPAIIIGIHHYIILATYCNLLHTIFQ